MKPSPVDLVYEQLADFARRSREVGEELHPGLSLVAYTQLSFIANHSRPRAVDIARRWGLDKSTVSRQIDLLIAAGLVLRAGEQTGQRGVVLELTRVGRRELASADASVRAEMIKRLQGWSAADIEIFGQLLSRFNAGSPSPGAYNGRDDSDESTGTVRPA